MYLGLASVTMLFLGITSAYIVREQLGDWASIAMPRLLLVNTVVLLASSFALEMSRRALSIAVTANRSLPTGVSETPKSFQTWIVITLVLGVLFLFGQVVAWQQLAAQGIFLNTSQHSSFFYALTGLHGAHLLGGVVALGYLATLGARLPLMPLKRRTEVAAIYWHFMDGLWVYLLLLLFVWR